MICVEVKYMHINGRSIFLKIIKIIKIYIFLVKWDLLPNVSWSAKILVRRQNILLTQIAINFHLLLHSNILNALSFYSSVIFCIVDDWFSQCSSTTSKPLKLRLQSDLVSHCRAQRTSFGFLRIFYPVPNCQVFAPRCSWTHRGDAVLQSSFT